MGRYPPDVLIGPFTIFSSMDEVEQAAGVRYEIVWCGDALKMREQLMASRVSNAI